MSPRMIDTAYALRHFGEILNQVNSQAIPFHVTTGNQVIARILPATAPSPTTMTMAELDQLFSQLPSLGEEEALAFAQDIQVTRNQLMRSVETWD